MKPSAVVKKWERELEKLKKKTERESKKEGWSGRQRSSIFSKRSSKLARELAGLAGMKSMGEVKCAADMEARKVKYKYEPDTFTFQHKPQHYTPDFKLKTKSGKTLYIEYKGKMTQDVRTKMLRVRECNPNIEIAFVFECATNGITKRRKKKDGTYSTPTKYWEWAEKNGFKWSEHTIREEWLDE